MGEYKPQPRSRAPRFAANVRVGAPGLDIEALRQRALSDPKTFGRKLDELIGDGLRWRDIPSRRLSDLYHALADVQVEATMDCMGRQRAVTASAFPLLTGGLAVAGVNDAYDAMPTIGEQLVTDFEDSKKVTHIVGITSEDSKIDRVDEANDFPEIGAGEERFDIMHKLNGRRLSITAETIEENDVSGVETRINALGEIAAELIEEQTIERVTDHYGSAASPAEPYVLRYNGAGLQLYNATAENPGARAGSGTRVTNNALVDNTDLEAARLLIANMLNTRGKRINVPLNQCILLVPDALVNVADRILGSEMEPGVFNELNPWGPRGRYRPKLVSSPKLDDYSTSAWYLGMFPRQFRRKWKLRAEYVTLGQDTESYLRSRIAFQMRVAWDCEIGAVDYVYVVQCLSGTTAPADE